VVMEMAAMLSECSRKKVLLRGAAFEAAADLPAGADFEIWDLSAAIFFGGVLTRCLRAR
jgi:hypothetical protein